jgi:hypothetical protein
MALMEIRLMIAALVIKYESWTGVPDVPGKWDEEMKPFEGLTLHPRKGKAVLRFKLRK